MAQKVRYNGGTKQLYPCSDPTNLVVGKEYEVVCYVEHSWHAEYTLKGVEGSFNSTWFDKVSSKNKTYMAFAHEVPAIGKSLHCYKMEFSNEKINFIEWFTSPIRNVHYMGDNIYHVSTRNSVYIVNLV